MTEQRRLFRYHRRRCAYLITQIYVASMPWIALEIFIWILNWAGAKQLLPAVTTLAQLVKAAMVALVTSLLYNEGFGVLQAQRMRLGVAAERSLVLAARRAAAGSGGQQPSTP